MLRQAQSVASDLAGDPPDTARPEPARPTPQRSDKPGLDGLRAEVQRRLAAQIDLGTPDPEPAAPVVERITPKVERPRMDNLRAAARRNVKTAVQRKTLGSFLPMGRWRMRPSRILLVLVALTAGGLAAFLATQHEGAAPAIAAAPPPQIIAAPTVQVLVAKTRIDVGDRLSAQSLQWASWPQSAVTPQYITSAKNPEATTKLVGTIARSDFIVGEPIREEKLAPADQGYLASVLGSGMRGVSVSVSADSASGGFISPNDRVDVMVTHTIDGQSVSDVVLRGVRVLAINDRLGPSVSDDSPAPDAGTASNARSFADHAIATLELNTAQAQLAISASATGKLSLMLRAADDGTKTADDTELATNASIRLTSPFWTTGPQAVTPTGSSSPPTVR